MENITTELKIIDFAAARLVGQKTTVKQGQTATKFVTEFRKNGTADKLSAFDGMTSPVGDIAIWMGEYDAATKCFNEIPGVFFTPDAEIPVGYETRELAACKMALLIVRGATRSLSRGAHNKLVKLMANSGYVPDYSYGYSMEYYSREKYEKSSEIYEFVYMLPCRAEKA